MSDDGRAPVTLYREQWDTKEVIESRRFEVIFLAEGFDTAIRDIEVLALEDCMESVPRPSTGVRRPAVPENPPASTEKRGRMEPAAGPETIPHMRPDGVRALDADLDRVELSDNNGETVREDSADGKDDAESFAHSFSSFNSDDGQAQSGEDEADLDWENVKFVAARRVCSDGTVIFSVRPVRGKSYLRNLDELRLHVPHLLAKFYEIRNLAPDKD